PERKRRRYRDRRFGGAPRLTAMTREIDDRPQRRRASSLYPIRLDPTRRAARRRRIPDATRLQAHVAIVAQAAATVSLLAGARFRLGLGSGERLNEHVIGGGWPSPAIRQERFEEAIDVIRRLFGGEDCSHCGVHFELDRARLFDLPDPPPQIFVSAG